MILTVVGWVLWSFTLLYGLGVLSRRAPDLGVRRLMRLQGFLLLGACGAVLLFGISKLWLILAFPIAFFTPLLIMPFFWRSKAVAKYEAILAETDEERRKELLAELTRSVPLQPNEDPEMRERMLRDNPEYRASVERLVETKGKIREAISNPGEIEPEGAEPSW